VGRKSSNRIPKLLIAALINTIALLLVPIPQGQCALTIEATQSEGNVIFTYSGDLNLVGLTNYSDLSDSDLGWINPQSPFVAFLRAGNIDIWQGSFIAPDFGTGGESYADTLSGDMLAVENNYIGVTNGYAGEHISGSMTFVAQTFTSLGINPGVYTWTLPNDTVTLTILQEPRPVLRVSRFSSNSVSVSWEPTVTGFRLEETMSLSPPNWTNSPSGTTNPAIISINGPTRLFRLVKP